MSQIKEYYDIEDPLLSDPETEADYYPSKKVTLTKKTNKSRTSCCKLLCFAGLGLFGLLILAAAVAGIWGYPFVRCQVVRFTVSDPMELPVPAVLPKAECELIKDRAKLFYDTILAGLEPDADLTVSEEELNGCLVANSDYMRGNLLLSIADDSVEVRTSLPTDFLPGGYKRYLVSHGSARIETGGNDAGATLLIDWDTYEPIDDIHESLLSGVFNFHEEDKSKKTVMNVMSGNFLNWIIPQHYIDEKKNIIDDVLNMYDDSEMNIFLMGIQGISFSDEGITILAHRDGGDDGKKVE